MRNSPSAGADNDNNDGNPLPGDDTTWQRSPLGLIQRWPEALRGCAIAISAFTYPAALFWGANHVLLHNKAWSDFAGGTKAQGQPQKDSLSTKTAKDLQSVVRHGYPLELRSQDLLTDETTAFRESSTAILSPLLTSGDGYGVMVQLLSKPTRHQSLQMKGHVGSDDQRDQFAATASEGEMAETAENTPIDEHPFFRRFAEMLPSGLAILDHNAQAVFVNQHFYDLTSVEGDDKTFTSWPQSIHPEDYDRVINAYHEAFKSRRQLRTEFRASLTLDRGEPHPWRLLLLTPLGDENLQHVSLREYGGFICSIVDISSEKSAELAERKAAQQARERKEQQERFIDMISHEIRNPLSAVLHCAEDIGDAVQNKDSQSVDIETIREAVETINLCVTHQKNIVDDVLSFSKLDASLLSLVPKPSEPSRQLQKTLKMFQHEFRKQHMEFGYTVDDTYKQCNVSWVMADLSRVSQVLINLVTNAIKFTHHVQGEKLINCRVAASLERPSSYPPDVVFFQSDNLAHRMDATNSKEWGNGEAVYIMVAVQDSGIGISEEGQRRLFERFRQATPKTEEVYGGSGLGLNISRKICHLHGGEIGVSSKEGKGSTFGFFFKVKRSDGPENSGAESADEDEGSKEICNRIQGLGENNPGKLQTTEPFEWSPSKDTGRLESVHRKSDSAFDEKTPSPDNGGQQGDLNGDAKRPNAKRMVSADVTSPDSSTAEHKRPVTQRKSTDSRAHVLLVEDNVINQKIVFRKLEAKGFNVTTANNGQEAVEAVRNAPKPSSGDKGAFDVILMDQEMPVMDGNTATRAIRELEPKGEIERVPILGVTANARGAQQDEMLENGMDDVLSKPYKIDDMVAKINKVAGLGREGEQPKT